MHRFPSALFKSLQSSKTQPNMRKEKRLSFVVAPKTSFERVFYGKGQTSASAVRELERAGKQLGRHIHHALCGHAGELWIEGAPVDGYDPKTLTVFQYHGCHWHGRKHCFPNTPGKITAHWETRENRFIATAATTQVLRQAGYHVIK